MTRSKYHGRGRLNPEAAQLPGSVSKPHQVPVTGEDRRRKQTGETAGADTSQPVQQELCQVDFLLLGRYLTLNRCQK